VSRERARTRAAREAARVAEREKAARARARRRRVQALRPTLPAPRRRPARYGAMPRRTRVGLGLGWLLVQFLGWQVLPGTAARLGLALVSLFAIPLVVTLYLSPRSSR
jgi:hypothetical protein